MLGERSCMRVGLTNTKDKYALIDKLDYLVVSKYKWRLHSQGYASTKNGILMHRVLLSATKGQYVDHKNRDKLDNRRSNIRIVTQSQNMFNQKFRVNNRSGVRGVSWDKEHNKWFACIRKNRKTIWTSRYLTLAEAQKAYEEKALELYNEIPC